ATSPAAAHTPVAAKTPASAKGPAAAGARQPAHTPAAGKTPAAPGARQPAAAPNQGQEPHELSRTDARRIAVRAQLLDSPRPPDLHEVVRHLTMLQIDPIAAVAPSADLVLWSRLGSSYSPSDLTSALEDRSLIELRGMVRPAEDIAFYRADMAHWDQ